MWVRGLKLGYDAACLRTQLSHPMWVRGLKHVMLLTSLNAAFVAPHVGAWIETLLRRYPTLKSLSHPMWVRGLKPPMSRFWPP